MIVIDASVVVKWFQEEKDSDKARSLQLDHIIGVNSILIPRLLYYELANTFCTKSHLPIKNIQHNFQALFKMKLQIYEEKEMDLMETTLLAKKKDTSFYDMLYAVVAKNKKCDMVTADERFVKATKFPHVKLLSQI